MIDCFFVYDLWVFVVNELEFKKKLVGNVLGIYMKNIGMKDYKLKIWVDSEFDFEEE